MDKVKIDKVFNRLRARLYNMIEQIGLAESQEISCKKTIRDMTSVAWNDIAEDFNGNEEEL